MVLVDDSHKRRYRDTEPYHEYLFIADDGAAGTRETRRTSSRRCERHRKSPIMLVLKTTERGINLS